MGPVFLQLVPSDFSGDGAGATQARLRYLFSLSTCFVFPFMHFTPRPRTTVPLLAGLTSLLGLMLLPSTSLGQGCMATRVSPPMLGVKEGARYLQKGAWEASFSYRFYEGDRHFYDQNKENVPANAPRVKRVTYDASVTRMLSSRTSVTVSVPFQDGVFDRSPIPPHTGSADKASGLGDVALTFRRWMRDPEVASKYNVRLGLGVKFPTGNENAQTNRLVNTAAPGSPAKLEWRRGPADVAIQPGDGGWGLIMSLEGFYELSAKSVFYGEVTYIANPRGHNGVNNQWSGAGPYVPNPVTTVPDYFLSRVGVALGEPLGWKNSSLQLGLRLEGQPVGDLLGSDKGFRRPGYTLAFEPGVAYSFGKTSVFLSVPLTIYRVRWLSVDEKRVGRTSAVSAAFADYNVLAGVAYRW